MLSWSRRSSYQCSEVSTRLSDQGNTKSGAYTMHRALSIRSKKSAADSGSSSGNRVGFSFSSLRGSVQPELARKIYKLIKTTNNLITAHETAGRERNAIANQLSEWGEQTGDEAISDVSDKVGVIMSEMGEQEDLYAHAIDDSRGSLKMIRNTEKSVQPSRDGKRKIVDEIAKLKSKEPESPRLVVLEQELVRAEAENLVAEAQLTNVTRQRLKEAYDAEFLATIERAEKQILLARHGRRLIQLLDDSPVIPGEVQRPYQHGAQARQILNDAEDDLRDWRPEADEQYTATSSRPQEIPDEKIPVQLQSPTMSSVSGEQQAPGHESPQNWAAETTPTAGPEGEQYSLCESGLEMDGGVSVSGDGVVTGDRRFAEAKLGSQSPQQQLEGNPTVVSGSPVSSAGGWRQHDKLLRPEQADR